MAPPGRLQDSLLRLLASLPDVRAIHQAADVPAAQALLAHAAPQLLILDWERWGAEAEALLRQVRAQAPRRACVGVVSGPSQQAAAWQAGVETVLLRGFSVQEMEAAVRRCAAPVGEPAEPPAGSGPGNGPADGA